MDKFYSKGMALKRKNVFLTSNVPSIDINLIFLNILAQIIQQKDLILDIGTGNGYVLSEINKYFPRHSLYLTGIDNSPEMLKTAYQSSNIHYLLCENEKTPFPDNSFDIITAKNVTRFNPKELFRILKNNSFFLMREYGQGKGLVEVAKLFPNRLVRSRTINFYEKSLVCAGFSIQKVLPLKIKRKFNSIDQLIQTITSFPFIENLTNDDIKLVRSSFSSTPIITSDPFILLAKKEKQYE